MIRPNDIPFSIILDNRMIEALSKRSEVLTHEQALIDLVRRCLEAPPEVSKNDRTFALHPGEAEVSFVTLSKDWGWDRKTVRKFLTSLQSSGCLSLRKYTYGTIASFPTLITSPSQTEGACTPVPTSSSPSDEGSFSSSTVGVQRDVSTVNPTVSIVYDGAAMLLDDQTRQRIRSAYELFRHKLPLLETPPFDERTEKAIYHVFILGMQGDEKLLENYLDRVAGDEYMNGDMAELSGDASDKESFTSLFSPRWLEILYPSGE